MTVRCAVLTVSDRASAGIYADETGPLLKAVLTSQGWIVEDVDVVPDDQGVIAETVLRRCADGVQVLVLSGGTGVAPRDVTPEAVLPLIEKHLSGFGELMRIEGLKKTPRAALSRSFAGTRAGTLILGLPGSPRGAEESLRAVLSLVPAVVSLLKDGVCP